MRLVQVAAGYARFDAIAAEMRCIDAHVRAGRARPFRKSVLVAERVPSGLAGECRRLADFRAGRGDLVIVHYGMLLEDFDRVAAWACPRVLVYHNITPADYFRRYDPVTAGRLLRARLQLPSVVAACDRHFAVSEFNAREVRAAGAAWVRVRPVLFPIEQFRPNGDDEPAGEGSDAGRTRRLLFVGRFAPNKNHLDLLKIFALLRESLPVRLTLAGRAGGGLDLYLRDLRAVAETLGVAGDVDFVCDAGADELARMYRCADLFLCASHHEGFCVPLLEAMAADLPVLACQAQNSAVGETMAGAGLGFAPPRTVDDYRALARAARLLLIDDDVRARVIAGQRRRLAAYRPAEILAEFFRSLNSDSQRA